MAGSESEQYYNKQEEETLDAIVTQAVEAAAKGENTDQLLELMLASVPAKQKEILRKKFSTALKKRNLREPRGDADIPSHSALARLKNALATSAKEALDRVVALVRKRSDIAAIIEHAGRVLTKHGVTVEKIQISESELGAIAPDAAAKPRVRGDNERGV